MKKKKLLAIALSALMIFQISSLSGAGDLFSDGSKEDIFDYALEDEMQTQDEPIIFSEEEPISVSEVTQETDLPEQDLAFINPEQPELLFFDQEEQSIPEEQQVIINSDEQQIQETVVGPTQTPDATVINQDSSLFDDILTEPVGADLTKPVYITSGLSQSDL